MEWKREGERGKGKKGGRERGRERGKEERKKEVNKGVREEAIKREGEGKNLRKGGVIEQKSVLPYCNVCPIGFVYLNLQSCPCVIFSRKTFSAVSRFAESLFL